jgi:flagellar hook assembly protein FlgD
LPIPLNYTLFQNYPNPFNPITKIRFGITKRGKVTLTVSNILGQCVSTLLDQEKEQGQYEISFNGANLPSGVYYYKIITHDFIDSKKMLLLK